MRRHSWRLLALAICGGCIVWMPACGMEFDSHFGEVYIERESGSLQADLYIPKAEGTYPGVLVVHGGAWHMGTRAQLSGVAQMLARHGFSAVAISYRLAPEHKFPAQIEDCKSAVRWMRTHAEKLKIDPERIAGFGYSAGAHLVALLGTTDVADGLEGVADASGLPSSRLQAVVGGGAPCDFRQMPANARWLAFWLGGSRAEVDHLYRLASPASFVTPDDPPMFFFHGEHDDLVPIDNPQSMMRLLADAGVPAELYVVPQMGHIFAAMDRYALEKSVEFLSEQLHGTTAP